LGLTNNAVGKKALDAPIELTKIKSDALVIALAGNPNVGKSTVFNALTGLNQHTGNWPGKTVTTAWGNFQFQNKNYVLVDIPGTYSLMAHSAEEEVARNFICFGKPDAVVIVCDATCLERNFNLVLQTIEITNKAIVCVNLMDEAKKKNIQIDFELLSQKLGVPVIGTTARKKQSLDHLIQSICDVVESKLEKKVLQIKYSKEIEDAIHVVEQELKKKKDLNFNTRWLAIKLLDYDKPLIAALNESLGYDILSDDELSESISKTKDDLEKEGITSEILRDKIVSCLVQTSEDICVDAVTYDKNKYNAKDRKLDKILTGKWTGFPIMIALLAVVFWLTITGANYPSMVISNFLFWIGNRLTDLFQQLGVPSFVHGMVVLGAYRVLAFVVSVMLPPMAIFFPLFTLLEDSGYLPRIAFNLDHYFKRCNACGKQALTMCMGFGCNAAGVVGCRIIDSPRERLIAIITNNFVPCNGRFPTMIAIITMFFVAKGPFESVFSVLLLTCVILLGIVMTFAVSKLLSKTILKGVASSFTLELPPYRKPQLGKILVRSVFDRTLFVLGRAAGVAAPAGLIIWIMANVTVGTHTLLAICSGFFDPFARLLGLDGVILLAFLLGLPANEIVVPIIIMTYMASGSMVELDSLSSLKHLLTNNGWTWITAVCTMLFSLIHWPCSTTCLTIKKETQSLKWTAVSFLVPTVIGMVICFLFATIARIFYY